MAETGPVGLYIHIPFCLRKCLYCDFLSFGLRDAAPETYAVYVDALCSELRAARQGSLCGRAVDTLYIGGGTPTVLPPVLLARLCEETRRFNIAPGAEFTCEANPGTLDGERLYALRQGGVNRLSLGLQAVQDGLLRTLGRAHTARDFFEGFAAARAAGFGNISADLMFALPGQTVADWDETLACVTALNPEHISAYSLTLPEGQTLWQNLPDDETDRAMYRRCGEVLARGGYTQYELSNYARPGCESRHNTRYWTRAPYYGFGLGASSFDGTARWRNAGRMDRYLRSAVALSETGSPPREEEERLTERDAMAETMILGLRLTRGVSRLEFCEAFDAEMDAVYGEALARLTQRGLLADDGARARLTPLGMDLANQVFVEFI